MPSTPNSTSGVAGPGDIPAAWTTRAHELFESVADRMPDHEALVCGSSRLTYAQLEARSNAIAHALIERGVERGDRVLLALPRCVELFATLLGILKAGAAYVPVDPNHPAERIRRVIEDSHPKFIATNDPLHQAWIFEDSVLDVRGIDAANRQRPDVPGDPSDIAYVIYTSGSTGTPKGVPIRHEGIGRLVFGQSYAPFGPELSWLKIAPMGFDASTIEIYGAWLHGAPLVVWDRDSVDADGLAELCLRERVGACFMSFGLFSTMLELRPDLFASMRVATIGGEALLPRVMLNAIRACPQTRFVNGYGPTEATAFTTTYPLTEQILNECIDDAAVPIGYPLNGLDCKVIDASGHSVQDGIKGELAISGVGVSPGYLNRPELNEEKFVSDPDNPSRVMYRTGDLARRSGSGPIEYLGRIDSQVKVRGNRVELGEIDAVLGRITGIRKLASCVIRGSGDDRIGVVYLPEERGSVTTEEIMRSAADHLPSYMVPGVVQAVNEIPTTENGKIDRGAVERLLKGAVATGTSGAAAAAASESLSGIALEIAEIWSDVLGVPVLDGSRSFVSLGGHSLKAMVLSSKLESRFGVNVTVPELLGSATLWDLSVRIEKPLPSGTAEGRVNPVATSIGQTDLSPAQERLWVLDRLDPGRAAYTIAIRLLIEDRPDRDAFSAACMRLIRRHSALRTVFEEGEDGPYRRVADAPDITEDRIDLQWFDAQDLTTELLNEIQVRSTRQGFDLAVAPLIRFLVIEDNARASVLITMHHIVSDGWSCEVIQRDLASLYQSELTASAENLPSVHPDPNRLWAIPEPEHVQWWERHLAGSAFLRLPRAGGDNDAEHDQGVRASSIIDRNGLQAIRSLAVKLGVTPFAVVNAAYHAWLHRMTREEDVVLGLPVACRDHPDLEHAVGFFMATLPMRTTIRSEDSGEELVARVAESFARSDAHRTIPFQKIVDVCEATHDPNANPLFEVFLNHIALNLRDGEGDLRFDETEVDNGSAKFDLTCYSVESEDSLEILLSARRSLVGPGELEAWAEQIVAMLQGMVADPGRRIGTIGLQRVPITERFQTNPGVDGPQLAHERVRRVAEQTPELFAFRTAARSCTYKELIDRSDAIAAWLASSGIEPGHRVLVACEDGISAAASLLGVMAAGCCALLVDSAWPHDRLQEAAQQGSAAATLSDLDEILAAFAQTHPAIHPATVERSSNDHLPSARQSPGDEAYVLFTSGTTGKPKGVVQSHGGLVRLIESFADSVAIAPTDSIAMTSSLAFDSAIMDMFGAWFRGAECRQIDLGDSAINAIDGATIVHVSPGVLRLLASDSSADRKNPARVDDVRSVRAVVLGGEPAFGFDAAIARRLFPEHQLLVNGMGMSESSLTVQWRACPEPTPSGEPLPIGGAVAGNRIRLLDASGYPTDLFGEIELTSETAALGYLVPDGIEPIGVTAGGAARRFRTGDLARVRVDGVLEHAGRNDQQLKVLGVRIEPAEIVAALRSIKGVTDAAISVLARSDDPHAPEELGAVVEVEDASLDEASVRAELSGILPRSMVPAVLVCVKKLPRTGNGKLDRQAIRSLLTITEVPLAITQRDVSETEAAIIACFSATLGVEQIGVHDDFFRLGGNSLLALRAFARLKERLGTDLPVITMFRAPTAAKLAEVIESDPAASGERALVSLAGDPPSPALYFAPGIGGNPHSFAPISGRLASDFACVGYQLPGVLGQRPPIEGIEPLAEDFAAHIPPSDASRSPPLVGYSFGGSVALQVALRFQRQGKAPGKLIMIDAHFMPGMPRKGRSGRWLAHATSLVQGTAVGRVAYLRGRFSNRRTERELGGAFQTDESLKPIKRLIEANRRALAVYRPAAAYQGDLLLFRARQPDWMRFHKDDGANGWRSCVTGNIEVVNLDVDHNQILHAASSEFIANRMQSWLQDHSAHE